jgi:di/tricarboxylate transporter
MSELTVILGLLAAAIVMFAINKPRLDAVALIMLTALPLTGVLTMQEALAGFSDPNIVLIAALFVIGEGLVRTGVAQGLGDWLTTKAGANELRLTTLLMTVVCALGATMSSTAVTAIFIPVALRIAQGTGIPPGRLMMPISFAALISGMTTLVATAPNLVVNSELERHGIVGFSFFSFTPFGMPILVLGIIYMAFARRWLPAKHRAKTANRPTFAMWVDEYGLANREYRLLVTDRSPLAGKTLEELNLRGSSGANIVAIERSRNFSKELLRPTAKMEIRVGDVLLIDLLPNSRDIQSIRDDFLLEELPLEGTYFSDRSQEIGLAEVISKRISGVASDFRSSASGEAVSCTTEVSSTKGSRLATCSCSSGPGVISSNFGRTMKTWQLSDSPRNSTRFSQSPERPFKRLLA